MSDISLVRVLDVVPASRRVRFRVFVSYDDGLDEDHLPYDPTFFFSALWEAARQDARAGVLRTSSASRSTSTRTGWTATRTASSPGWSGGEPRQPAASEERGERVAAFPCEREGQWQDEDSNSPRGTSTCGSPTSAGWPWSCNPQLAGAPPPTRPRPAPPRARTRRRRSARSEEEYARIAAGGDVKVLSFVVVGWLRHERGRHRGRGPGMAVRRRPHPRPRQGPAPIWGTCTWAGRHGGRSHRVRTGAGVPAGPQVGRPVPLPGLDGPRRPDAAPLRHGGNTGLSGRGRAARALREAGPAGVAEEEGGRP